MVDDGLDPATRQSRTVRGTSLISAGDKPHNLRDAGGINATQARRWVDGCLSWGGPWVLHVERRGGREYLCTYEINSRAGVAPAEPIEEGDVEEIRALCEVAWPEQHKIGFPKERRA